MITIPTSRKTNVLKDAGPYSTKRQKEKIWKGEPISLTKNQKTSGGFLPLLLGAIGTSLIPTVIGAITGKGGLQIDSQSRSYRRIPRIKKKIISFENKPINNFDGVFDKNNVRNENCGIINLDDSNGPGKHWTCYINDMYFDPFGLPPPENLCFIKRFNNLQYQSPKSVFCVYYWLFCIKKYQEGYPLNQEINERIIKTYYINHGNV